MARLRQARSDRERGAWVQNLPEGDQAQVLPSAPKRTQFANLALLLVSLLLSVALIEIGFRVLFGLPIVALTDWRTEEVVLSRYGVRTALDPVLGWTNLPWIDADGFQTIDYGIRQNFDETTVRTGAVLAVGDSFTEGWNVGDAESWPAQLEGLTGVPIVNAGIGSYGTDQIVLRAETLLPLVKPRVLIVGFLEDDIFRAGYSMYGTPKPYFTLEQSALLYHPPGPIERRAAGTMASLGFALRDGLGHFAAADYLMARLAPDYWYSTESVTYEHRAEVDIVSVTCMLLRRLKAQADESGIRTALFMQYTAQSMLMTGARTQEAEAVIACAQDMAIRVIDLFPSLHEIATRHASAMRQYYALTNGNFDHMSAKGNTLAAELLEMQLQDWLGDVSCRQRTLSARLRGRARSCRS